MLLGYQSHSWVEISRRIFIALIPSGTVAPWLGWAIFIENDGYKSKWVWFKVRMRIPCGLCWDMWKLVQLWWNPFQKWWKDILDHFILQKCHLILNMELVSTFSSHDCCCGAPCLMMVSQLSKYFSFLCFFRQSSSGSLELTERIVFYSFVTEVKNLFTSITNRNGRYL